MATKNSAIDEPNPGGDTTNYDSKSSVDIVENNRKKAESEKKICSKGNAGQTKKTSIPGQDNGTEEEREESEHSSWPLFAKEKNKKDKGIQVGESSFSGQVKKTKDLGNILDSAGIAKSERKSKAKSEKKSCNKENAGQTKKTSIPGQGNGTEEEREESEHSSWPLFAKEKNKKDKGIQEDESSFSDQVKKTKDLGNILTSAGIILVVAIACTGIFVAVFISTRESEMKSDFDLVTIFGNGVNELQQSFTNQTQRFWMILKNRGLAHLRNKYPTQPMVILLAAPPPAHEWVDCLATKLAEKLDPERKRTLTTIDGNQEKDNSADKTKEKMDEILEEKFKAGHRVALIHHLELLPPPSPLLIYSYCDDQNAPHKHVTIIFTVNLPDEPNSSLSPKEAEGIVEEYLANEVWSKVDKDAVSALLSRIATTVALMNGESTNSPKAYCS